MSVENTTTKVVYAGNGVTKEWPVPFQYARSEDIALLIDDGTTQTDITSNYQIVVNESGDTSVTYPVSGTAVAAGNKLAIYRSTPRTQVVDLVYGGAFAPDVLENDGLDRIVMMTQELSRDMERAVKLAITSEDSPENVVYSIYASQAAAEDAAERAEESEKACNDVMLRIPAPESKDIGKFLIVRMNDDLPGYALVPQSQMQGYFEYTIPVVSKDGVCTIVLAEIGHPEMQDVFNPIINIIAAKQYYHCIKDISKTGFLVQIYRKDGTPGVDIAEYIESSTFTAGENQQCGTPGSGATVKLGISIPNPGAQ